MKRDTIAWALGLAILIDLCLLPVLSAAQSCEDHGTRASNTDPVSSAQIHKHREGVIVPLGPTGSATPLTSINVTAEATFFSCMVRNFIVNVRAEFVLGPPDNESNNAFAVAFPITTHALYGDHNRFRDITVTVDGTPVSARAAMDYRLWKLVQNEVWYQGRLVNHAIHPLLADAKDLNIVAPHLVARGYDLVIYWHVPAASISNTSRMVVTYTSNTDDFSSCCHEVRDPALSSDPHHFYFDLSNARYWRGPKSCTVILKDSATALWSSVPVTNMDTTFTEDSIILTRDPAGPDAELEDLAVPAQPAVFGSFPRRWPMPPPPVQTFTLSWRGGTSGFIDRAVVDRIEPVGGIRVNAKLPMTLSKEHPSETFLASFMPPIADLAYIDVFGCGYSGLYANGLYSAWLRIPMKGKCITGHDLAVKNLRVIPPGSSSEGWAVRATVANVGVFTEPLLVTVLVNNRFVKTEGFRSLLPGDVVDLTIGVDWAWELPAEVEVEVEPAPGEVNRMNNAAATCFPAPPLPRHANFVLQPDESNVLLRLDSGLTVRSKLLGAIKLYLGDPSVPVPFIPGVIGLSVDGADLIAPFFSPTSSTGDVPVPLYMFQSPKVRSTGHWNTITGEIRFEMYLVTPHGPAPAQQPTICSGRLVNTGLSVTGLSSEPTAIPKMILDIYAYEGPWPPQPDVWFSTEVGFHAGRLDPNLDNTIRYISAGDLLSRRGHVVRTNRELTQHLGIMPAVPDLGLDAVVVGPRREIWFSFEEQLSPIWSETLAVWLKHGDLLSDRGYVVATNEQLVRRFGPMPVSGDFGLDAAVRTPTRDLLFSTETDFFSETLGARVGHGDVLSSRGRIVRTNRQLLASFNPVGPVVRDLGLDALVLRPFGEMWFSTEEGFIDANLGPISDGDLLSSAGYVVARNLDLLKEFGPIEDLANFGLDAAGAIVPWSTSDFDQDGDVDESDLDNLTRAASGPGIPSPNPEAGDFDGDGDVDQVDFGIWQRCYSGPDRLSDPECGAD
ncbi:MAG TPA: hypothetical protein PLL20_16465 [Phycisphaerae bacterium]|nr:hypothetical protein [Phycisphaerae bacterium]HRR86074.1 hypothetical protein [Phycisphaerae bacterium]